MRIHTTRQRNRRYSLVIPRLSVFGFLMTLPGCNGQSSDSVEYFMAQPQILAPPSLRECAVTVNSYVLTQRSWPEVDFNTSFDGIDQETGHEVFRISHLDTYQAPLALGGVGSSFFVHADCTEMEIVGEFKQQ
jgi:hypothetical protein